VARRPTWLLALPAATLLALPLGGPTTAGAASGSPTCSFSAVVTLDPGLSRLPSAGTFATPAGRDGRYSCRGPYGWGKGPSGTASATGRYGTADADTCADGGEGSGTLRLAGRTGDFTFKYGQLINRVAKGTFDSTHLAGTFTITALKGGCTGSRVTEVRLEGEGKPKR
jgi:hypothetical protein